MLRAVVCFDWRIGRAELTPRWHSIPFRHTSLFTNYSEQNATVHVSLWRRVSSMLLVHYHYTLRSFRFYITLYTINQNQTMCSSASVFAKVYVHAPYMRSLWWGFFGRLFAVVLRLDQESGGVIVTQWICTVFKCKFTALQWWGQGIDDWQSREGQRQVEVTEGTRDLERRVLKDEKERGMRWWNRIW